MSKQNSCHKIISGGQTGVDRGALDAAIRHGFPCGGWCPENRLAEDGIIPGKYPLTELINGNYSDRTKKNVEDSDGTLIIYNGTLAGGTLLTVETARKLNKAVFLNNCSLSSHKSSVTETSKWISEKNIKVLNVAGPRQSEWDEGYMISLEIIGSLIKNFSN